MEWLMEYDRTKRDSKCKTCDRFYKLLDDVAAEDLKNINQITPHKARIKISKEIMDKYKDSIRNEIDIEPRERLPQ